MELDTCTGVPRHAVSIAKKKQSSAKLALPQHMGMHVGSSHDPDEEAIHIYDAPPTLKSFAGAGSSTRILRDPYQGFLELLFSFEGLVSEDNFFCASQGRRSGVGPLPRVQVSTQ